jgi:beta-glucosidase
MAGDEIVMVFVSFPENTTARRPAKELKGFTRVHLEPNQEKQVTIPIRLADLDYFQTDTADPTTGKWTIQNGRVDFKVGGSSTDPFPFTKSVQVTGF